MSSRGSPASACARRCPTSVIDKADDIELIDLTPDDLIQRLRDGKVYVPQQAERAVRHYFSPGNLTALRELALRRTAQRVDDADGALYAGATRSPARGRPASACWPASAAHASSTDVVRHAKRMADSLRAPWTAIHVETGRNLNLSDAERDRIAEALRLAQRLGAETVTLPGQDVADTIADYARANNFTHIIVVQPPRSSWRELLHGSLAQQLIRKAGGASVHVVGAAREAADQRGAAQLPRDGARHVPASPARISAAWPWSRSRSASRSCCTRCSSVASVALAFLTAVLVCAVVYGLWPALFASFVSVLAYNFFFLPPLYTFTIADPENVVALFFFAVTAVIASNLTARVRAQAIAARQRARTTEELYQFSRKLAGAANLDDLLWATVHQIALMLKVRVVILLPEDGTDDGPRRLPAGGHAGCRRPRRGEDGAGKRTMSPDAAPTRCPAPNGCSCRCSTGRGAVGVVGIDRDEPGPILTPDQQRLLDALADQAALAIERVNLVEDVDRARLVAETDRLRSALLTSISHDLRTPLASILGSATSLATHGDTLDAATRLDLTRNIQDEAERLNRFIGNLLDMTRLESGPLRLDTGPIELSDAIGSALRRARKILAGHRTQVDLQPDLPMLDVDVVLFEQVLFNLLDNAGKYAPAGSLITIRAWRDDGRVGAAGDGRRPGHSAGRPRAHLRQVLSRRRRRSAGAPAPAWALRSAAASSRRWTARSPPATAPIARARCSPSSCRRSSTAERPAETIE